MGSRTAAIKPSGIQRSNTDSARSIADSLRIATQRHEGTGTFSAAAQRTRTSLPTASGPGRDFALIPAFTRSGPPSNSVQPPGRPPSGEAKGR
jgi:hypothetical protein